MTKRLLSLPAALALLLAAGCGSHSPPPGAPTADPQPTYGTITFPDGSPLRGGMIMFTPKEIKDGSKIRFEGAAMVDDKGAYKIGFNGDGKGVPEGDYTVQIQPRDYNELRGSNSNKIPKQYHEKTSTPFQATVKSGDNKFDWVLR
jgi:hypothetical protein